MDTSNGLQPIAAGTTGLLPQGLVVGGTTLTTEVFLRTLQLNTEQIIGKLSKRVEENTARIIEQSQIGLKNEKVLSGQRVKISSINARLEALKSSKVGRRPSIKRRATLSNTTTKQDTWGHRG